MATSLTTLLHDLFWRVPASAAGTAHPSSALLEQLPEVIFRTDSDGHWRFLSAGWQSLTGFSVEQSLGATVDEFLHPRDRDRWRAALDDLRATGKAELNRVLRLLGADGEPRWLEWRARAASDELLGLEGFMTDITLAERRRRAQRQDSLYDPLTHLPAEALFRDRLQRVGGRFRTRRRWRGFLRPASLKTTPIRRHEDLSPREYLQGELDAGGSARDSRRSRFAHGRRRR